MRAVEITRETNNNGAFSLYAIGDLHSDRKEFNEARFKAYRAHIIKDPRAVAIFVGDAMEGRTPGMKHFDAGAVRSEFLNNLDSYVKMSLAFNERLLKPIVDAGVPLVVVEGNHDRYQEYTGYAAMLADRVGAHFLADEGFVRIRTGLPASKTKRERGGFYTTVVYATHGHGGGRRPGGKVNEMQSTMEWVDADVIVKGHVHDGAIRVIHRYGVKRSGGIDIVKTPVALYRAPSFVERAMLGVSNYAGRLGYPATDDGLQYLTLDPHYRTVQRHELPFASAA